MIARPQTPPEQVIVQSSIEDVSRSPWTSSQYFYCFRDVNTISSRIYAPVMHKAMSSRSTLTELKNGYTKFTETLHFHRFLKKMSRGKSSLILMLLGEYNPPNLDRLVPAGCLNHQVRPRVIGPSHLYLTYELPNLRSTGLVNMSKA